MKGEVRILDGTGHTTKEWDTDVPESLEVAREIFERGVANGNAAFDTSSPTGGVAYDTSKGFTPDVESLTFVPRLAGG